MFSLILQSDSDVEGDETFTVTLSNPTVGTIDPVQGSATGTIENDDVPPPVVVATAS